MYSIVSDGLVKANNNIIMEMNELVNTTSNQEESGRGCRNKKKQTDPACCPVCSITLRISELNAHLGIEIDRLSKLSGSSTSSKHSRRSHGKDPIIPGVGTPTESFVKCWEIYQKVKNNRQDRLKIKSKKRKSDERTCPVCNQTTTQEEITLHVELCLQRMDEANVNIVNDDDDMTIDVEGDADGSRVKFDEYEWAGQMRVRASSLLEGGFAAAYGTTKAKTSAEEDDVDVVVDGDDTQIYGAQQYTDEDVRNVTAIDTCDEVLQSPLQTNAVDANAEIIESLKIRIRELEGREHNQEQYKCLICMGRYKTPVVSICCWHVHCEHCWLRTLAVKKLCPQCNMITSTNDLRRIYI